jgi:hypothetical protein
LFADLTLSVAGPIADFRLSCVACSILFSRDRASLNFCSALSFCF